MTRPWMDAPYGVPVESGLLLAAAFVGSFVLALTCTALELAGVSTPGGRHP